MITGASLPHSPSGLTRDADARMARQRADPANQLRRPEDAVAMEEARREVGDLDALPFGIEQARLHDRGAVLVALLDAAQAFELDASCCRPRQPSAESSRAWNTGSPSNRGMQHQTMAPRRSTSALIAQLPISARSSDAVRPPECAGRQRAVSWPAIRRCRVRRLRGLWNIRDEYTMTCNVPSRPAMRLGARCSAMVLHRRSPSRPRHEPCERASTPDR